jgi:hypothetical protein
LLRPGEAEQVIARIVAAPRLKAGARASMTDLS